jgi:hypothetical protein
MSPSIDQLRLLHATIAKVGVVKEGCGGGTEHNAGERREPCAHMQSTSCACCMQSSCVGGWEGQHVMMIVVCQYHHLHQGGGAALWCLATSHATANTLLANQLCCVLLVFGGSSLQVTTETEELCSVAWPPRMPQLPLLHTNRVVLHPPAGDH